MKNILNRNIFIFSIYSLIFFILGIGLLFSAGHRAGGPGPGPLPNDEHLIFLLCLLPIYAILVFIQSLLNLFSYYKYKQKQYLYYSIGLPITGIVVVILVILMSVILE